MTPAAHPVPASFGRRTLALLALALGVGAWWYAAWLPLRGEHLARNLINHRAPLEAFAEVPLAPGPARAAAQRRLAENAPDFPRVDALFAHSIALRPLYAPYWLDRAEAALNGGQRAAATNYLATATRLWPNRPVLQWKAAMLYTRLGEGAAALAALRDYVRGRPHGYREALGVARHLVADPAEALRAVLPEQLPAPKRVSRDDLLAGILSDTRRARDPALARAAWAALSAERRDDPDTVRPYVEWLAGHGALPEARAAWAAFRGVEVLPALENGGFEAELRGGLGWRLYNGEGFAVARDTEVARTGAASLRVDFAGTSNVNLHHLRQYLPVTPGAHYRLEYAWRGTALSTRAGPYLEVIVPGGGRLASGEPRWGDWDWTREWLTFTVPLDTTLVELRLRRNPTDALDQRIGGHLWLDDFRLETAATGEGTD